MPERQRYTIAICKGAALLDETRTLIEHWKVGETAEAFVRRVEQEGLLGKATAYRVRDIVRRVFVPRYLKPDDRPARMLKGAIECNLQPAVFKELVLLYSSRNDPLLRDFVLREFWPSVRRGRDFMDISNVLLFFSEALTDGRIDKPWSDQVSRNVAWGLLGFLREADFIRESQKGKRELIDYRISDGMMVILARILKEEGFSDSGIVDHPDWNVFGLERMDVLARLHFLGEEMGLLVQQAGSVVSFNWKVRSTQSLMSTLNLNRQLNRRD
ncbi:MAG: BrxA family protein [Thermodesulfobacteriota bacterium]|nr:BrxA family protein [Thermodesulfobacteriota bacterium]